MTAWSQVNEEKLDIVRDSLPAQDKKQKKAKAELFIFFPLLAYMLYRF